MQSEQVIALHKQGMPAEDIAREMRLDVLLVRSLINADPEEFSEDDRAMAKKVIVSIAKGGEEIAARDQLKAALYIHSGRMNAGADSNISVLQRLIAEARNVHNRPQRVIDITPNECPTS